MQQRVRLSKAITYILAILTALIVFAIYPLGIIRNSITVKSNEIIATESEAVNVANHIDQMFTAKGGELKSVDLYVCNDMAGQTITFRLYDESHAQIFERFYDVEEEFVAPGFVRIPVRFDMEDDKDYYFIIEGLSADLYVAYEERATANTVNYFMTHGDQELPEYDVIIRYNYLRDFATWQIFLVVAICVLLISVASKVLDRKLKKEVKLKPLVAWITVPMLTIVALLIFYEVMVKRIFGINTKNNAIITLGFWMILAIPGYFVLFCNYVINTDKIRQIKIRNVLQTISIATMLWYCYEYMNGLYDIFHYYSISKLVIAGLCFAITTFDKKEIKLWPNILWLIVGPIIAYQYYKPMIGDVELEELYKYNAWVIVLAGFLVINIIFNVYRLIKKQVRIPRIDKAFMIPFAIMALGICVLSNTRNWPGLLVGICVTLMYRLLISESRDDFTRNLCSGIILNFYMMVWFSLNHRPYYFYQFYRYDMGYHTVTVTAYYLSLIVCAAWVRLFDRFKNNNMWYEIIPKLFTFGMAASYLIFTMSRTGFLSSGCMLVFALFVMAVTYYEKKKRISAVLKLAGLMVSAAVYMFPVTYALTDVCPRIANDPITFEYEYRFFTFEKGMPLDDPYYMTIQQFFHMFGQKVFGLPDKEVDEAKSFINPFSLTVYAMEDSGVLDEGLVENIDQIDMTEYAETEEYESESDANEEDVTDMSNGRFDIFKAYLSNANLWGHDDMGVELPDKEIAVHAHNSFIQVIHDHGIIYGIYFVFFIGYVVVYSCIRMYKCKTDVYKILCPVVLVCFCMASLVEWIFHPCNPLGLAIFLAMMPLGIKDIKNETSN